MIDTKLCLSWGENETLEGVACQLQKHAKKYIYVVDGLYLRYFNDLKDIPTGNRTLEHELSTLHGTEYYVRNHTTNELWCCFLPAFKNALLLSTTLKEGATNKYASKSSYMKRLTETQQESTTEFVPNPNKITINMQNPFPVAKTISKVYYL
jgi:hypothetical protein